MRAHGLGQCMRHPNRLTRYWLNFVDKEMKWKIHLQLTHDNHIITFNNNDKHPSIPNIGGKTWNTGQHVPKVSLVANVIASWTYQGQVSNKNNRKEQDLWAETIPSKNLQLNSQAYTAPKNPHKEKGGPIVMACDSSVRSRDSGLRLIGWCWFHPWQKTHRV